MFDILFYLVENFFQNGHLPDNETISRQLTDAGFEKDDISEVLAWLKGFDYSRPAIEQDAVDKSSGFRVFSAEEQKNLSSKARGFLIFLQDSGIILPHQREIIIEQVISLAENQVGVDEVKLIVLLALWSQQKTVDGLVLEMLATNDNLTAQ